MQTPEKIETTAHVNLTWSTCNDCAFWQRLPNRNVGTCQNRGWRTPEKDYCSRFIARKSTP